MLIIAIEYYGFDTIRVFGHQRLDKRYAKSRTIGFFGVQNPTLNAQE